MLETRGCIIIIVLLEDLTRPKRKTLFVFEHILVVIFAISWKQPPTLMFSRLSNMNI